MTTLLYTHKACLNHHPGHHHPEAPERLQAVLKAMEAPEFDSVKWVEAPLADPEQIARAHPRSYVDRVLGCIPEEGFLGLDGDTIVSPGSGEAALRAAGAVCAAIDAVMAGKGDSAFCAIRPPGHHAEPDYSMGFCLFNNAAVGAYHARHVHGLKKVAVLDFDVHHGNGTQAIFYNDPDMFFASTHQVPLYPGTGGINERGVENNIVNIPLPPHCGSKEFRDAWSTRILKSLYEFTPDFIIISAGFDAHRDDPLAQFELDESDFAWITKAIMRLSDQFCGGKIVSTLEGGYDLSSLSRSASAHMRALMRLPEKAVETAKQAEAQPVAE